MNNIKLKRCVKPKDAANEQPMLIIFIDGSDNAFGASASREVPAHMQDGNSATDNIPADLYYQKIESRR